MAQRGEPQSLRLDQNGRVVIPASLRRALNVKPGDRLVAWLEEGRLIVRARAELVLELRARFRGRPGEETLMATLRRARDKEVARDMES